MSCQGLREGRHGQQLLLSAISTNSILCKTGQLKRLCMLPRHARLLVKNLVPPRAAGIKNGVIANVAYLAGSMRSAACWIEQRHSAPAGPQQRELSAALWISYDELQMGELLIVMWPGISGALMFLWNRSKRKETMGKGALVEKPGEAFIWYHPYASWRARRGRESLNCRPEILSPKN